MAATTDIRPSADLQRLGLASLGGRLKRWAAGVKRAQRVHRCAGIGGGGVRVRVIDPVCAHTVGERDGLLATLGELGGDR